MKQGICNCLVKPSFTYTNIPACFKINSCNPCHPSHESLEDTSPGQTYHDNLIVVFILPFYVIIYSLNEKNIFFILLFQYPIIFSLFLLLPSTFHLSIFLLCLSLCILYFLFPFCLFLCMSSYFTSCLSPTFLLWLSFFILYFFFLLLSLYLSLFYFLSWLSSTFFLCLSSIIFPLPFSFSFGVCYYYYFPVLLFCIFTF